MVCRRVVKELRSWRIICFSATRAARFEFHGTNNVTGNKFSGQDGVRNRRLKPPTQPFFDLPSRGGRDETAKVFAAWNVFENCAPRYLRNSSGMVFDNVILHATAQGATIERTGAAQFLL